ARSVADVTPERLAEIEARAGATTPGPWTTEKPGACQAGPAKGMRMGVTIAATSPGKENRVYANPPGGQYPSADRRFIAASRTDVPDLCAALRQAWAERDAAAQEAWALREAAEPVIRFTGTPPFYEDVANLRAVLSRPRTAHAAVAAAREKVVEAARVFASDGVAWPLCNAVDALAEAERTPDAPGR
ncbi:hypothetical protein, partial [Thiomonas sp.]